MLSPALFVAPPVPLPNPASAAATLAARFFMSAPWGIVVATP
jgi:hypothetical protein